MTNSRGHRSLIAIAGGLAALAAGGLLAGCGAGKVSQTADIVPAVPGANLDLTVAGGRISVRNATVDYPGPGGFRRGDNAPLTMRIINGTSSPIGLTAVTLAGTSADLGTVRQVGGVPSLAPTAEAPAVAVPTRNPTPSPATPRATTSRTARPSRPAATVGAAGSAGPAGSATIDVRVPATPDGLVILRRQGGGTYLLIHDLTRPLLPGTSVRLVLTFTLADGSTVQLGSSNAPREQLLVPVAVPLSPGPRSELSLPPTG